MCVSIKISMMTTLDLCLFLTRFMTAPVRMGMTQHQSLPLLGGNTKRVIIPDVNGIDRPHPVSEATLHQVCAIIEEAEVRPEGSSGNLQQPNVSLGSLPSATSNFSSMSSLGSSMSATGSYNPQIVRKILLHILKKHCIDGNVAMC